MGLAFLVGGCVASAAGGDRPSLALADYWEDTAATRDLPHPWRVYRRTQLPNGLYRQLFLYLVQPENCRPEDRRPALVFIHGGGWGSGDPGQWFTQCRYFASRGLVTASVEYRLKGNEVEISGCFADCKSAIRYLRRHAGELGIDPSRIAVVGSRPAATWRALSARYRVLTIRRTTF